MNDERSYDIYDLNCIDDGVYEYRLKPEYNNPDTETNNETITPAVSYGSNDFSSLTVENELSASQACVSMILASFDLKFGFNDDKGHELSLYDMERIFTSKGLKCDIEKSVKINEIAESIDSGECVICIIDELQLCGENCLNIPYNAAYSPVLISSISIGEKDYAEVELIDPVSRKGAVKWKMDVFIKAWEKSQNTAVIVYRGSY